MELEKEYKRPRLEISEIAKKNITPNFEDNVQNHLKRWGMPTFIFVCITSALHLFFSTTLNKESITPKPLEGSALFVKNETGKLLTLDKESIKHLDNYKNDFFKAGFDSYQDNINNNLVGNYFNDNFAKKMASLTVTPEEPRLVSTTIKHGMVHEQYVVNVDEHWTIDNKNHAERGLAMLEVVENPNQENTWLVSHFSLMQNNVAKRPQNYNYIPEQQPYSETPMPPIDYNTGNSGS